MKKFLPLLLLGIAARLTAAVPERPNVLFIFLDDLAARLGTYGDPLAKTPNLDAFARTGMRFDRAYCANPVCLPSRTAILTGLRPETTGVLDNRAGNFRRTTPLATTLPQYFAHGGYQVASVGKTFYSHGSDDAETEKIMQRLPTGGGGWPGTRALLISEEEKKILQTKLGQRQTYWGPVATEDAALPDGQAARAAARFLQEPRDKPFFLAVGIFRPHNPFTAPKRYFDLHPLEQIVLPPPGPEDAVDAENVELGVRHGIQRIARDRGTENRLAMKPETRRQMIQAYNACVSFADAQVGVVLAALRATGLDRRTIVVCVGDNGFLLGEHGVYAKSTLYEEAVRIPLIVSVPGVTPPGRPCARLVELVDLYPTLTELCGLGTPAGLDGTSFVPLLKNPARTWKRAIFSIDQFNEKMVRTEQWKLIALPDGGGMLFDVERDPGESRNLYASPAHQPQLAELKSLLARGWKAVRP